MQTEKLFYADAYQRTFDARVIGRSIVAGHHAVALDRTAFYPTGGGQPNDSGTLHPRGEAPIAVLDVTLEGGLIWHVLDREMAADEVRGEIDWDRRFDHMQQHTGQHILSQAIVETSDAETVSFRLGTGYCTIDLNRANLASADLTRAEARANEIVELQRSVTASVVLPDQLAGVPLRKPPKVTENIRVVQVEGFDWSACGGTHVVNCAEIGLIKVTGFERRGSELRVTFLCGRRARADYARLLGMAQALSTRFTTGQDGIVDAVDRRAAEMDALRKDFGELEKQWVDSTAAALWSAAQQRGDLYVISQVVDFGVERAKRVAQALRGHPGALVLLGVRGERPQLLFGRADDVTIDAGALLKIAAAAGGGRGGGRSDWAQGGVSENVALATALSAAAAALPQG